MTENHFTEHDRPISNRPYLDTPDMVSTDKVSLFDMHEDMKFVDCIAVEELNDRVKDEENRHGTKRTSASERKYFRLHKPSKDATPTDS